MTARLPALFLSHGSPTLLIDDCPARDFLAGLSQRLARPSAILMLSAHHDAAYGGQMSVTSGAAPPTIHDFRGFPEALYRAIYTAPGAPELAARVAQMVSAAGLPVAADQTRGFDHGAWVPLAIAWPDADIPLVQLSVDSRRPASFHHTLGRILASLRDEGVLVIGSGSMTHNLRHFAMHRPTIDAAPPPWVSGFADWVAERAAAGDEAALTDLMARAPHARDNHPTPDHIVPFFAAMGAGGSPMRAERWHASTTYGVLAMDAYAFH